MASVRGKRVIFVGPADGKQHKPLTAEGIATEAAILPGTIIDRAPGGAGFRRQASTPMVFGVEQLVADKNHFKAKEIDEAWDINETMSVIRVKSGGFVNALVLTDQVLVEGTALQRTNTGFLRIMVTDGSAELFGYSAENVTTTALQLVCVRIR